MTYVMNLGAETLQWIACFFVVALYLDCRRLRRRVAHLEEASRWRMLIERGDDPRNHEGWHEFHRRSHELEAGLDVVYLWDDKRHPTMPKMPRPFCEPAKRRA
jgi:hypothetical protein